MTNTFVVDATADYSWGSNQGYVTASYAILKQLLGDPNWLGDEYKVSTGWVLRNVEEGFAVTIHDFKQTNLYNEDYPTVEQFRAQPSYEWSVGAKNYEQSRKLVEWLNDVISHRLPNQTWEPVARLAHGVVGV
jgi:hypothetical protein